MKHICKESWPTKFKNFPQNLKGLKKCLGKLEADTKTIKPAPSA